MREHPFMMKNYRFDYAWPEYMIAIEYQGGTFMGKSGHKNVSGQTRDCKKINEAQLKGWLVILVNPKTIDDGSFIKQLNRAFKQRKENYA